MIDKTKSISFINFFRAMASFWVAFTHAMIWGGWYELPIPNPKIAVDLFMIISGYLMMLHIVLRKDKEPIHEPKSWLRFWLRRYFRIAPLYYLSLLIAVLLSDYFLGGYEALRNMNFHQWEHSMIYDPSRIVYDIKNIWMHLTFLFGLDPQYSFSTFLPDWSLSLEMQFYFVFPFLILYLRKIGLLKGIWALSIISVVVTWLVWKFLWFYEPSFLAFKLQYFLVGVILFYLLHHDFPFIYKSILFLSSLLLLLIESKFHTYSLVIIFLIMLTIGNLEIKRNLPLIIKKIIDNKLVTFMSDSSYSLYLFHGFFIAFSGYLITKIEFLNHSSMFLHTVFIWIMIFTMVYPLSYLLSKTIEKKGIHTGRKVIEKLIPIQSERIHG